MSDTTPDPRPDLGRGGSDAVAALRQAHPLDLGTLGAGLLAFLGSLLPYYTWSVDVPLPGSATTSLTAWHGVWGWLGAVLALAGAAVLALHLVGTAVAVPVRTAVLALFALGTLATLLALVTTPGPGCDGELAALCDFFEEGRGAGYWLALLASVAGTALAGLRRTAP